MDSESGKSRIPSLHRSASVRVRGEKASPNIGLYYKGPHSSRQSIASVESHDCHHGCGDSESLKFHGSNTSLASCGSSQQALGDKGSCSQGRRSKFVLHCQRHFAAPQETYLTPTQRKDRELRSLRTALARVTRDVEEKSLQLQELSKEIELMRRERPLTPHSEDTSQSGGSNPNEDGANTEITLYNSNNGSEQVSRCLQKEVQTEDNVGCESSVSTCVQTTERDSGYASSLLSNSGLVIEHHEEGELDSDEGQRIRMRLSNFSADIDKKDEATQDDYEVTDLKRKYRDLKQRYNDRTENLLQMLSDLNAKYLDLRPAYEGTQDRLRELERQLAEARQEIERQELWHSEMYLKMYRKGKEAAKFEQDEDGLLDTGGRSGLRPSGRATSPLLQQLRRTEQELGRTRQMYSAPQLPAIHGIPGDHQAEYTLRFLKDAVFYFLTDRTDFSGHLNAIQSILGFSEAERAAVAKAWRNRGRL